ncbi:MAG: sulfite exporter TauE/SafE family protein [Flavisolibacter sp.]
MKEDNMKEAATDIKIIAADKVITAGVTKAWHSRNNKYLIGLAAFTLLAIIFFVMFMNGQFDSLLKILSKDHHMFYWMVMVGFLAEIVAGSMGMGYGVICTTVFLIMNIPPPVISASIHSAESFTTAAGSISHYKFGNVNKKLTKKLAIPAIIGAVLGAILLSYVGERYARMTKPLIGAYTLYLGIRILKNAFAKKEANGRVKKKKTHITSLGFIGGFIDSFGGGGWGPMVTGTFIKNGRTPRYVIGSSTVAKFILTLASAITFIFTVGIHHWNIVAGLLLGGIITAPFSAMLTAKLPVKKMFVVVGIVVIVMSVISICRSLFL